jgi:hypothetical protein
MHVAGRGIAVHAGKMLGDEQLNFGRREIILTDGDTHNTVSCAG